MMLELKQYKPVREREWENTPKELGLWGLVEREKGKGPIEKAPGQKIEPLNARMTSSFSILFDFIACTNFYVPLLFHIFGIS